MRVRLFLSLSAFSLVVKLHLNNTRRPLEVKEAIRFIFWGLFITMYTAFSASLTLWHGRVFSQLHLLAFTRLCCSHCRHTRGISLHVLQLRDGNTGETRQENWRRNWFRVCLENTTTLIQLFFQFSRIAFEISCFHLASTAPSGGKTTCLCCIFREAAGISNQIIRLVWSWRHQWVLTALDSSTIYQTLKHLQSSGHRWEDSTESELYCLQRLVIRRSHLQRFLLCVSTRACMLRTSKKTSKTNQDN